MKKEPLLFLCHRIPFPPNKGDKIRSFNILKALSEHYDIHLGSFVDDPFDWQYADKLNEYCQSVHLLNQNKLWAKIKGLSAFLTGKAISLPYYASANMQRWVNTTVATHKIRKVFVYSSVMAQFSMPDTSATLHQVVDFVDVDSDKWRQYALGKSGVSRWIYLREYVKLQKFENFVARHAQQALFVSGPEADLFKKQVPESLHPKVSGMLNGVDIQFFDPNGDYSPLADEAVDVVFTGAMDYWANADAVLWFSKYVWPKVRAQNSEATFYIVGGNPTADVKALDGQNDITVTGRVKDVRPYIAQAKVTVAPLQIARGIQNKVLEAMSMGKAVVATSMAIEGIEARNTHIRITDDPQQMAAMVNQYLVKPEEAPINRQWIQDNLQWQASLSRLPSLFEKS